jgi:hypothetical protein
MEFSDQACGVQDWAGWVNSDTGNVAFYSGQGVIKKAEEKGKTLSHD